MSFMSGMMMGAAIGRNIHEIIGGKNRWKGNRAGANIGGNTWANRHRSPVEPFALVSNLKGRCRYRISALTDNKALAALLKEKLEKKKKISKVEINTLTGSLLIIHNMNELEVNELTGRLQMMMNSGNSTCGLGQGATKKAPVLYSSNWHNTISSVNNQIRLMTNGWFDLSSLLSILFLIRGLRKIFLYGQRPSGPAMVWWALHMMKGWKN